MTDAERIAKHLGLGATPESVEAMLSGTRDPRWAHKFSDGEAGHARAIAAMLDDVRREERESCIAAIGDLFKRLGRDGYNAFGPGVERLVQRMMGVRLARMAIRQQIPDNVNVATVLVDGGSAKAWDEL